MVAGLFGAAIAFVWRRVPALAQRRPAQQAGLLGAALAAFAYALLAGFGVPAQRTLYMLLVAAAALASGRILAPSRILTLALLVVLLVDPWAVLASGFWLSFGAVAALLYIGSARLDAPGGWRAAILGWGAVQWAATLASLPVLLLIFQQFSLVSPLANALAVPVISFLVAPLALLAAILPWWPVLALAHGILDGLMQFLFYCAAWPVWQTPAPPLWAVLAAALGVAVCLLPRRAPVRPLGFFLLLPALFWPPEPIPEGEARIDVLDVGQGQAVVVRTRHHVLIDDPGPLYGGDADAGQRVVVPYLRWLGVDRIDTLLVTHRDSDHAGGLGSVLSAMPVDELLSSLPEAGGRTCRAGQHWQWDGVDFAVLHPLAEAYAGATASNHLSCVLSVTAGRRRVLLTGDIEAVDEAALLARDAGALRAEVLVVPHHGSKTSSSPAFIAAVAPSQVVFSVGYRNRFGHPHPDVAGRYERSGSRAWRTDRDGAIRIELAPAQIALHAWRAERPRYWHGR